MHFCFLFLPPANWLLAWFFVHLTRGLSIPTLWPFLLIPPMAYSLLLGAGLSGAWAFLPHLVV